MTTGDGSGCSSWVCPSQPHRSSGTHATKFRRSVRPAGRTERRSRVSCRRSDGRWVEGARRCEVLPRLGGRGAQLRRSRPVSRRRHYLAEGTGLATRYVAIANAGGERRGERSDIAVRRADALDGPAYERWVAGYDVETGTRPRAGCAPTGTGCGSSRSSSTGRKRGRSQPRCTQESRLPTTPPRNGLLRKSSGGWLSTRRRGSGPGAGRCRCRSTSSRPRSCGTTRHGPETRTGTSTCR